MPLSSEDRRYLLTLARQTIARTLEGQEPPKVDLDAVSEVLRRPGASFVTLTQQGELRGCIGSIEPRRPLVLDVQENAVAAAFHDPRFPPLAHWELERTHIEISVLTPPQPLEYEGPTDLLTRLRPGVDGVIIERGWHRATFLPQVWEKLPDPREFLAHLCLKAGLPPDDYRRPGLRVYTYQVDSFEEE
ncbi:MAG: AmmeMemoRadiSam system protein A [Anaerolineae bacterium]|nr:AmmeMemoRadiSam system protein A [Anaerolineae bacterium]MDW8069307.1 AmmeMemoRadiSam system protein A [Anaerolineae bacterium]